MSKYIILVNPGHNRIYFDTALQIAQSEVEAIMSMSDIDITFLEEEIGGIPASISFNSSRELNENELKSLGSASIYYALFELLEGGLLKPIVVPDFHEFSESMVQILRYSGKTNEQFTRLMVNLALSACKTSHEKITLFDPMCGKGTTLYEGLIRGFDVKGVEINDVWTQEIQTYIVRFLKEGRYKHRIQNLKHTGDKGKRLANLLIINTANTKDKFNSGDFQTLQLFNADTRISNQLLKRNSCDIIVSDLPYGVQHGSKVSKNAQTSRSPISLLKECLPAWSHTLKKNGSIVLSYNEFTMKYSELAEVMTSVGLTVLDEVPYNNYLHRVDQSINRNLIVAVKL